MSCQRSRFPQRALVIDCEDDSLLEDTDELLVSPLEPDYNECPSIMYGDDSPREDYPPMIVIHENMLVFSHFRSYKKKIM